MLNHSTWRLNDSTFRLNRQRTCQHWDEAGMLKAEHASIGTKLASWRRNLPGSRREASYGRNPGRRHTEVALGEPIGNPIVSKHEYDSLLEEFKRKENQNPSAANYANYAN